MSGPVTIGDLMRDRRLLWVYCRKFGRERDLDPSTLPLPSAHPVPEVGKHMRCSACGLRKLHTAPELYPGGIEAMRARWGGKQPSERAVSPRDGPGRKPGAALRDVSHWPRAAWRGTAPGSSCDANHGIAELSRNSAAGISFSWGAIRSWKKEFT